MDKIEKMLPGLQFYKKPSEQTVQMYLDKSNPKSWYNNIWIFIFTALILILTIISLESKLDPKTVYVLTKSNESLMRSDTLNEELSDDQGSVFSEAVINTKQKLQSYLQNDFPTIFFDDEEQVTLSVIEKYVDPLDGRSKNRTVNKTETVKTYSQISRTGQQVVGPVRLHTVHTNRKKCGGPSIFITDCHEPSLKASTINRTNLGNSYAW